MATMTTLRASCRRLIARTAFRRERGSSSIQMVMLMPALFSIMFLGMQGALYYHARTVAIAAAQEGARAAGSQNGTAGGGISAASSFVSDAGGRDVLPGAHMTGGRTATIATVTVTGTSLSVFPGRVAVAHQGVQSAAADAARSASIARTQGGAQTAGDTAAATSLANQNVNCTATTVSVDTTGFASPVGTPAKITASVTCQVNLSDLLPGVPGTKAIKATMSSPLD